MSNARFSIIPSKAVEDKELSNPAFRTLSALGVFGDKNGWCFPRLSVIAEMLNKSPQAVSKDIQELKDRGYLNVYFRYDNENGAQKSNMYQIKFDTPQPDVDPPSTSEVDPPSTSEVDHNAPVNAPVKLTPQAARNGSQKKGDLLDGLLFYAGQSNGKADLGFLFEHLRPLGQVFVDTAGMSHAPLKRDHSKWIKIVSEWYELGFSPDRIQRAVLKMRQDGLTIGGPESITKIARDLAEANTYASEQDHYRDVF